MFGLTRIDLSFPKNLRSNWVVIIGLELLSLACPGLGLGSEFVTSFYIAVTLLFSITMVISSYYCGE
jgi:hypothetical protein